MALRHRLSPALPLSRALREEDRDPADQLSVVHRVKSSHSVPTTGSERRGETIDARVLK